MNNGYAMTNVLQGADISGVERFVFFSDYINPPQVNHTINRLNELVFCVILAVDCTIAEVSLQGIVLGDVLKLI